jgi:hypothetical protein
MSVYIDPEAVKVIAELLLGLLPAIVLFAIFGTVAVIAALAGMVAAWDWTARKIAR